MSDWLKLYLAIVAAVMAWLAFVGGEVTAPIQPSESGYPAAATMTAPPIQWADGCGVFHYDAPPDPWPTAIPMDKIGEVCGW